MAHDGHRFARVFARHSPDDVEDTPSHAINRLVAGDQAALGFVHEPERASQRDVPVRQPLEVAAELSLTQLRIGFEDRGRIEPRVDQLGRFDRAGQRAVHDAPHVLRSQPVPHRQSLRAAEGAQLEAVEMPV